LKKNQLILGVVVLAALVALVVWGSNRIHFDFGVFRAQLAMASWAKIGIAVGFIYIGYLFRSVRWAFLLRHEKKVPPFSLLSTQVIGFAAVALIGRVADPVRPYLVAKKTGLPLSNQLAVYIVERLFDFGAMALIISSALLWIPYPQTAATTNTSGFFAHLLAPLLHRFPVLSEILTRFGALLLTLVGVLVLVAVRLSGGVVARLAEKSFGLVSKNLGRAIGHKIRTFHAGLYAVRNFSDFAIVTALSLSMWCLITLAYLETVQAFTASPELAGMNLAKCILLMAISGGASALQLPVLGWFSQIAFVAAALSSFFGARPEAATACAATLLFVTFLSIIPVGVIWARFEHVNLRKVTVESEHAGADLDENGIATEA
jgi:hypothetical protein